ncbi:MAG: hypothetical protein ACLGIR_05350 [Actinomycetes bacterium]
MGRTFGVAVATAAGLALVASGAVVASGSLPPAPGTRAWIAPVALGLAMVVGGLAVLRLVFAALAEIVFEQRDTTAPPLWFVPGNGSHGKGTQPPLVPYSPDWEDRERRIS